MTRELEIVLGLLAIVAVLALLARRLEQPYAIVLVIAGLGLGWIPGIPKARFAPELFWRFLLPMLVYPAAFLMPWRDFRDNLKSILLLAIGLVLFTMFGIGAAAHWIFAGLPLASAFLLGAIVSPTDPLAATMIAQRMQVPQRIPRILEAEGLVNDSTGLVAYHLALGAVISGTFSPTHAGLEFLKMSGGGVAFGLAVGWVVAEIQRRIDDPPVEVTITLLTPFVAYLPADSLGLSGVLSVVTAGLFLGWKSPVLHKAHARLQAVPIWEMVEFTLNGLVFILIGLELPDILGGMANLSAGTLAWEAVAVSLSAILIRAVWVFAAAYLPRVWHRRGPAAKALPNWRHVALVSWVGMRGAVSLAAALSLPRTLSGNRPFPARDQTLFLTYSVILATLVVQGLLMPAVIRRLRLSAATETDQEEHEARLKAVRAVLDRLGELQGQTPPEPLNWLRDRYHERMRRLEQASDGRGSNETRNEGTALERLEEEALEIERNIILELRNKHVINDEVHRRIQHDLDLAESRLSRH